MVTLELDRWLGGNLGNSLECIPNLHPVILISNLASLVLELITHTHSLNPCWETVMSVRR